MRQADLSKVFPMQPPPLPGGRWLLSALILSVLLVLFWACGVFEAHEVGPHGPIDRASAGPPLFFSVIIAYIVPIFGYISERTALAIEALAPVLEAPDEQMAAWRDRIDKKPVRWLLQVLAVGVASGLLHNLLLFGSLNPLLYYDTRSLPTTAIAIGTLLVWITVTVTVSALLDNALLLNRLARRVRIQPFHVASLKPFASVAVISTLSLIGAQAAFPIMTLEEGLDPIAYIPGLLATGVPMVLLAALPVWPVHRRLLAEKRHILAEVNERISRLPLPSPEHPDALATLAPLLAYRREVAQIPEWPFDLGAVARLGLYLIIPPLTWVGAALIENLVDAFL